MKPPSTGHPNAPLIKQSPSYWKRIMISLRPKVTISTGRFWASYPSRVVDWLKCFLSTLTETLNPCCSTAFNCWIEIVWWLVIFRPQGWWWSACKLHKLHETETNELLIAFLQSFGGTATIYVSRSRIFEATKGHVEFFMTQLSSNDQKVLQDVSTSFYLGAGWPHPKCCQLWKKQHDKISSGWKSVFLPCQTTCKKMDKTWAKEEKRTGTSSQVALKNK